jgi:putative ATP-dependent endonuclease of the OLD family
VHICRIAIEHFRNFREIELTDLQPATVLVGENRSGKSNLIHALLLVLDPSLPDTARQLLAEDFWDGLPSPFDGHEPAGVLHQVLMILGGSRDACAQGVHS